ncbi:serine--tRNA synthetase-like protein Slimp [Epargyreus clarus]|uniref:serine--tRNA synthetase-like protein Slimp n=1 Tax=Epargyreus clarus TaxID=520877 RepID=UPI003C2B53E3
MAIVETLKIPNILHPSTPDGENKVIFEYLSKPTKVMNHLEVGRDLNLLNFTKNENYYLKSDAAIFELGAKFYFSQALKENNFVQFSNPDFVKSIIVEGCGEDHTDADSTFILHHNEDTKMNIDSRLHLTGAGSLFSFFAYHAKNVLHGKVLPLKYFAMGRNYKPSPEDEDCLFHVSQASVIQIFEVTKSADDLENLLQEVSEVVKKCYKDLGYHFRLSILPADKLYMWESLRVAIEMYSTSLNSYVEVGNISVSGDFISKRLMYTYTEDKESRFPHILSGTLLNVPKFLACVLEQDSDFVLPEPFKVEKWRM